MKPRPTTVIPPPSQRASWAQNKPAFCASCIRETKDLVQSPTGRNNGLVWLCLTCAHETPKGPR